MKKILLVGALPSSLINFRGPLLKTLAADGHKVFAAANGRDPDTESRLQKIGVEYCPIRIARTGTNPFADLVTLFDLIRLMRRVRPDMVLNYTIKPVIYGGLAAKFCGILAVFSMIEGLGRAFMPWESLSHALTSAIARGLYRISLPNSQRVFFLNPDDLRQFVQKKYVPEQKTALIPGAGVDLSYYAKESLPQTPHICFLMIARLLKDKGVREYVEAARILRSSGRTAAFVLVGDLDVNPSSITKEELDSWKRDGLINYAGRAEDVRTFYRNCHVYVLPSYREGMPRTVLEAMAAGRPVITTDAPGCRETIREPVGGWRETTEPNTWDLKVGRNGILIPARNADALARAMEFFLDCPQQIPALGAESRFYAEERYDVDKVNAAIMQALGLKV